ncbi:MAG TPA: right-handed parallel beta-helix repeat-containing protein [Puia sp.]|nr:right-handed parallel beta-helix repeat-containing protein [Puia sp.]
MRLYNTGYIPLAAELIVISLLIFSTSYSGEKYFISSFGNDGNAGTSPDAPWRTISKLNGADIAPGDSIFFRRGGVWREPLIPSSGDSLKNVYYGSYGEGDKPVILGSVSKKNESDWKQKWESIWVTGGEAQFSSERVDKKEFNLELGNWVLYTGGLADAKLVNIIDTVTNKISQLKIVSDFNKGGNDEIQLHNNTDGQILCGKLYLLTFYAKSFLPLNMEDVFLMSHNTSRKKYGLYTSGIARVQREWCKFEFYFRPTGNSSDERIDFLLGKALRDHTTLLLKDLHLFQCGDDEFYCDVGNVIFNRGEACGTRVWSEADLKKQGDFYFDDSTKLLEVYSESNPATYYKDVECALTKTIIDESGRSYIKLNELSVKYGGAYGIRGANVHHLSIINCDISYVGGGIQKDKLRAGNGIEFWGNASNISVENCKIWEVFDAGVTDQNQGSIAIQSNITYKNNTIWNCEYSFEYWNRPDSSITKNIRFINNTCANAGHGWGHSQRPDPSGRHLCFFSNDARTSNIIIENNIFYEATQNCWYAAKGVSQIKGLCVDYNCWYQQNGTMINFAGRQFNMGNFNLYRNELKFDAHSFVANPQFVDIDNSNFLLKPTSPCINAGDASVAAQAGKKKNSLGSSMKQ